MNWNSSSAEARQWNYNQSAKCGQVNKEEWLLIRIWSFLYQEPPNVEPGVKYIPRIMHMVHACFVLFCCGLVHYTGLIQYKYAILSV